MPTRGLRYGLRASTLNANTKHHVDFLANLLCLKSLSERQTAAVGPKSARSEAVPLAKGSGQIKGFCFLANITCNSSGFFG